VAVGSPAVLLVGSCPSPWVRPFSAYLLAEHTGCPTTRDCLTNTRTTLTLSPVRLFAWNMPYHAEHHAYPAVPFHALPRLHERVRDRLANVEPGYLAATATVPLPLRPQGGR
jgi:fatty acid desaturase